jgi:flagellar biosynthesis protein FlhB
MNLKMSKNIRIIASLLGLFLLVFFIREMYHHDIKDDLNSYITEMKKLNVNQEQIEAFDRLITSISWHLTQFIFMTLFIVLMSNLFLWESIADIKKNLKRNLENKPT